MYTLEVEKKTIDLLNSDDKAIVTMLIELVKKKYEEMMAENPTVMSLTNAEVEIKAFGYGKNRKFYPKINFRKGRQYLRYEINSTGDFESVYAFMPIKKNGKNGIRAYYKNAPDLEKELFFIFNAFDAPINTRKYDEALEISGEENLSKKVG